MEKVIANKVQDNVLLLGSGILYWIGLGSFAFLIKRITLDCMYYMDLSPSFLIISSELMKFITCIAGVYFVIKVIKTNKYDNKTIFIASVILILVSELLGFLEPMLAFRLNTEASLENIIKYHDFLEENVIYGSISAALYIIIYLVTGQFR